MAADYIQLGHGSGGVLTRRLIGQTLLRYFPSKRLRSLPDSAVVPAEGGELAFTTDSYVVDPIFFPGGDIGRLAVCGTVNDLAVVGALPRFVSCALILEEGLALSDLERLLASMQEAAGEANVEVVTGDTKVVPRGKADKVFINTAGIGHLPPDGHRPGGPLQPGDAVVVSGPLGDHGAAVLCRREGLSLEGPVESDCAPLTEAAQTVLRTARRTAFMRDLTRGGLATALNEAAEGTGCGVVLRERDLPVREGVRAVCELLGLDPLYLACEGRLAAIIDGDSAGNVLAALEQMPGAEGCAVVGHVASDYPGKVAMETTLGTRRLLQMLSGEQLPRIC